MSKEVKAKPAQGKHESNRVRNLKIGTGQYRVFVP